MRIEVVYSSGQTYQEHISSGKIRVASTNRYVDGTKRISVSIFRNNVESKRAGGITLKVEDAKRLGHALLLACSDEVEPIMFSLVERPGKAKVA